MFQPILQKDNFSFPLVFTVTSTKCQNIQAKVIEYIQSVLNINDYQRQDMQIWIIQGVFLMDCLLKFQYDDQEINVILFELGDLVENEKVIFDIVILLSSLIIYQENVEVDMKLAQHWEQSKQDSERYGISFLQTMVISHHIQLEKLTKEINNSFLKFRTNFSMEAINKILASANNFTCSKHPEEHKQQEFIGYSPIFLHHQFEDSLISRITHTYRETVKGHIQIGKLTPITIKPRRVLEDVARYILKEAIMIEDQRSRVWQVVEGNLRIEVNELEDTISDINQESCRIITKISDSVINLLKTNKDLSKTQIKAQLKLRIEADLDDTSLPDLIEERKSEYIQNFCEISQLTVDMIYQLIQEMLVEIIELDIDCKTFHILIGDLIESFISRYAKQIQDFSQINENYVVGLFVRLKESFNTILQDVNLFVMRASLIANEDMGYLNQILTEYHSLANVRTYQVLQLETSKIIVSKVMQALQTEYFFFRPEFHILDEQIVRQTIRHFYTYSTDEILQFQLPQHTKNFTDALKLIGTEPPKDLGLTFIQSQLEGNLWFLPYHKVNSKYETLFDCHILSRLIKHLYKQLKIPVLYAKQDYFVKSYHDIINYTTGRIAISLLLTEKNGDEFESLVLEIDHKNLTLVLRPTKMLSEDWETKQNIIKPEKDLSLEIFIQQKSQQFDYYNSRFGGSDPSNERFRFNTTVSRSQSSFNIYQVLSEISGIKQDQELLRYKEYLNGKRVIRPESMLASGPSFGLAGGSIGAGLGCLIIDSMDPNIQWNEKIKRAGLTTVSTGVVAALYTVPVVGIIIQQAFVAYIVKKTMSNQVISGSEKAKNVGHVGLQSTVGIGSAIAGQILIPVPVLGAIIGGTVGGVAIGLYQKLVVPRAKASMIEMITKLYKRIMEDGLIIYDEKVFNILKISKDHFVKNKSEEFSDSEWLTVVSVYLVNELYYLFTLQNEEKIVKIQEKIQLKPNDQSLKKKLHEYVAEFEEMEMMCLAWDRSRLFIQDKQISTLRYASEIGTFVNGMIHNFKL